MSRFAAWGAGLAAVLLLAGQPAHAQEPAQSLKIQPAVIEQRGEPGKSFASVLKVTNLGAETRSLKVFVRNIKSVNSSGQPVFSGPNEPADYALSSWVKIDMGVFELKPGEVKEIPFTVAVPADAEPGGHFGGIVVAGESAAAQVTGSAVDYQVASLLSVRVAGEVVEEANIREFRVSRTFYSKAEVNFAANVENLGNVLVRPQGVIDITNMFGRKVASLPLNAEAAAVFPKGTREFAAVWNGEGFTFGRYQAALAVVYGEEGRETITASVSFWVLPMNVIVPVLVALLVIVLALVLSVRLYVRRRLQGAAPASAAPSQFGRLLATTLTVTVLIILLLALIFIFLS